MKYLSICISIAFIAVAVFGFFAMMNGPAMNSCIAAISGQVTPCPVTTPALELIEFHVSAYQSFSQSSVVEFIALGVLLLVVLLGVVSISVLLSVPSLALSEALAKNIQIRELRHWISLHENSPTA